MNNTMAIVPGATQWFVRQFRWPNSVMFHYTSRDVLEAILGTRRMWAMDLRTMNDPHELVYGKQLIDKRIVKALRHARNTPLGPWLQTIRDQFQSLVVAGSSTFSISFSEHPDLPRQWRDYAANGTGFVLGWSIDSSYAEGPLKTWISYDRDEQTRLVDGLIGFHVKAMFQLAKETRDIKSASITSAYSLFRFLNAVWLTFKDPSWSHEAEFRYVYHVFNKYLPPWCDIKIRPENGRRYIEADFRTAELKYVGVGPSNGPEARRWVTELLDTNGFRDVYVTHSAISLP